MSQLIAERLSHWYRHIGEGKVEPAFEVPRKDGKGMKAVTLREARELNLWPSVTNILGVLNKPALNDWRVEQGILAALTLPRQPDEGIDAFVKRVVVDMDAQSSTARDFGTAIHAAIEAELTRPGYRPEPEVDEFMKSFRDWAARNIIEIHGAEILVGDPVLGFGGKMDLDCTLRDIGRAIVDFKTQRIKRNGKELNPTFYDEWALQLAAYRRARTLVTKQSAIVSVVIDSTEPGPVHTHIWEDDSGEHMAAFLHAFELWQYLKGYKPGRILHLL